MTSTHTTAKPRMLHRILNQPPPTTISNQSWWLPHQQPMSNLNHHPTWHHKQPTMYNPNLWQSPTMYNPNLWQSPTMYNPNLWLWLLQPHLTTSLNLSPSPHQVIT